MVKSRIELLLSLPLFSLLFCWYLALGMKADSPAQRPEALYKEKLFSAFVVFIVLSVAALLLINIPPLSYFLERSFTIMK